MHNSVETFCFIKSGQVEFNFCHENQVENQVSAVKQKIQDYRGRGRLPTFQTYLKI